jgi:hypothetical protein
MWGSDPFRAGHTAPFSPERQRQAPTLPPGQAGGTGGTAAESRFCASAPSPRQRGAEAAVPSGRLQRAFCGHGTTAAFTSSA